MNRSLLSLSLLLLVAVAGCDSADPDPSASAAGTWTYTSGPYAVRYVIEDSDGTLTGRVYVDGSGVVENDAITGTRSDLEVEFSYLLQFQGNRVTLFLTLAEGGATMSGYGTNTDGGREDGIVLTRVAGG